MAGEPGAPLSNPRSVARGTKAPVASYGCAQEDVIAKLINELLLLTCMGAFIASATYAVTLLH
jgi:hypothetical protein